MNEVLENLLELQTLEFGTKETAETAARVAELRGKVPSQILGHYERLRVRGKKGLALVQNQVCTGCHMRVPLGAIMTLKHADDIQLCDYCGRYLYLPGEEQSSARAEVAQVQPKPIRAVRRRKKTLPATANVPVEAALLQPTRDPRRINPG